MAVDPDSGSAVVIPGIRMKSTAQGAAASGRQLFRRVMVTTAGVTFDLDGTALSSADEDWPLRPAGISWISLQVRAIWTSGADDSHPGHAVAVCFKQAPDYFTAASIGNIKHDPTTVISPVMAGNGEMQHPPIPSDYPLPVYIARSRFFGLIASQNIALVDIYAIETHSG